MIHVNANLDLKSFPKIKMQKLNDLLWNLWEDPLYITFIARKEEFQNRAFRRKGKSYLRVVVPYDEVLKNEDNLPLLLHYLAKNVDRLKWLNHSSLKKQIEDLLGKDLSSSGSPAPKAGMV